MILTDDELATLIRTHFAEILEAKSCGATDRAVAALQAVERKAESVVDE